MSQRTTVNDFPMAKNGIVIDLWQMADETGLTASNIEVLTASIPVDRYMRKITFTDEIDRAKTYDQIAEVYQRIKQTSPDNPQLIARAKERMVELTWQDLGHAVTLGDILPLAKRPVVDADLQLELFIRMAEFFIVADD